MRTSSAPCSTPLFPCAPEPRLFTTIMRRLSEGLRSAQRDWPLSRKDLVEYLRPINFDEAYLDQAMDHSDLEQRMQNLRAARGRWY